MTSTTPVSIELIVQRFIESKRSLGRKYHSERRELLLFVRHLQERGVTKLERVTSATIDEFLSSRPRKRPRSFNHLLGVIRCLFDWAVAQRHLEASPLQTRPRRVTDRRVPFLFDKASAAKLLDAAVALPSRPKGPQAKRGRSALGACSPLHVQRTDPHSSWDSQSDLLPHGSLARLSRTRWRGFSEAPRPAPFVCCGPTSPLVS